LAALPESIVFEPDTCDRLRCRNESSWDTRSITHDDQFDATTQMSRSA
jgi:hypothetical protein